MDPLTRRCTLPLQTAFGVGGHVHRRALPPSPPRVRGHKFNLSLPSPLAGEGPGVRGHATEFRDGSLVAFRELGPCTLQVVARGPKLGIDPQGRLKLGYRLHQLSLHRKDRAQIAVESGATAMDAE